MRRACFVALFALVIVLLLLLLRVVVYKDTPLEPPGEGWVRPEDRDELRELQEREIDALVKEVAALKRGRTMVEMGELESEVRCFGGFEEGRTRVCVLRNACYDGATWTVATKVNRRQ